MSLRAESEVGVRGGCKERQDVRPADGGTAELNSQQSQFWSRFYED